MRSLQGFTLTRVLNEDPILKTLTLLGTLPSPQPAALDDHSDPPPPPPQDAILLIEKTHFGTQSSEKNITHRLLDLLSTGSNDIYFWWNAILSQGHAQDPDLKMSVIYPATEAHIQKYSKQERKMITESAQDYKTLILPWIESQPKSRVQWVYNILDGLKETENVLFRDSDPHIGFIVLPDSKWDKRTLSSLYLLVICQRADVRSLRDLKHQHLPMLKNIRDRVPALIPEKFPGVDKDDVRMFVHYHPSYYHFHVHVTHVSANVNGSTVGQSHLLETIIDNIEHIDQDYYSKASLRFALGVNHPVYSLLSGSK